VCFIADGDTRGFLQRQLGRAPGQLVEQDGTVVGDHEGSYGFTIGQRKGLRIDRPAADGRPRYVLSIEPASRTVTVGPAEALDVREIDATGAVWSGCPPPSGPIECLVQLRAHGECYHAVCQPAGSLVRISLRQPARGVAAGQAAVFYDGDAVLGSATITSTRPAPDPC
jgi:tRNA-specific 2-thiouridylase